MPHKDGDLNHGGLRRLPEPYYQGRVIVHWSMTLADRRRGWLDAPFHQNFLLLLLHTLVRESLICPAYCLMPDHMHLLLMGMEERSDQRRGLAFLRRTLNQILIEKGVRLQRQAYDHVLRAEERRDQAFAQLRYYIWQNPQRAELVDQAEDWPYSGALVPGAPDLDWRDPNFESRFWKAVNAMEARIKIEP